MRSGNSSRRSQDAACRGQADTPDKLWRDRTAFAAAGAEGARSASFQTLRQKDRGAPSVQLRTRRPDARPMPANTPSLRDLEQHDAFIERHIGPNDAEIAHMLRAVGQESLDALTDAIVPPAIRQKNPLALPPAMTETEALAKIRAIAD